MKKTVCLLLALLLTICLVACRPSDGNGSSAPTAATPTSSDQASSSPSSGESSTPPSSSEQSSSMSSPSSTPTNSSGTTQPTTPPAAPPTIPPPAHTATPVASENYYGYRSLNDAQKQAYTKMLDAVDTMPAGYIELGPAEILSERDVYLAAITLKNDHPELFWLPYAWYIGETQNAQLAILFVNETDNNASGDIENFTATYIVSRTDKQRMQDELKKAVNEIKAKITATDPYGIELQLHDILCERITYSKVATPLSYTAYGALVRGDAVCEGYTRAMQLLLYEFGINSTPVTGDTGQPHMWNLVELDGKWYHLDVTWNDQSDGYRHMYFNLTDQGISKDHTINADFSDIPTNVVLAGEPFNNKLPVCNAVDYYYFSKTGYVYDKNDRALAERIISSSERVLEFVGFNSSAAESISTILKSSGFPNMVHFETEGDWAKITIER